MSGISIQIDDAKLQDYLKQAQAAGLKPQRMLRMIGMEVQSEAKGAFLHRGLPGEPVWPDKPEHWAQWQGNRFMPLSGRTQKLRTSVGYDVAGASVRIGSPLDYAPTHQLGDDRPRAFYVYGVPMLQASPHGGQRIARFPNGYPYFERMVLKQAFTGEAAAGNKSKAAKAAKHLSGKRSADSEAIDTPHTGVIRVLVRQRSIRARKFLPYPVPPALEQRIYNICEGFLLGDFSGKGGLA